MHPVLLAHEDPFLRSYIAEKLQFMFDVEIADRGRALIDRLQARPYLAAIIGTAFRDIGPRAVAAWMRSAGETRPRQVILIRNDAVAAGRSAMSTVDGAIALSLPSQVPALIEALMAASKVCQQERWSQLSPVQQDLIATHRSIFDGLSKRNIAETVGSPAFAQGIDLLVETSQDHLIEDVLAALRDYDDYTFCHQMSVASLLVLFGIEVGIPAKDLRILAQAGILHDVGKRQVPLAVLHKPGALNAAEWAVMKDHVGFSTQILGRIDGLSKHVINVAAQHHERVDGSGYPHGLKAEAIDDLALVCAVADVFSALTDRRPYKPAKSRPEALSIMAGLCGSHLNRGVFRHFKAMIERSARDRAEAAGAITHSAPHAAAVADPMAAE